MKRTLLLLSLFLLAGCTEKTCDELIVTTVDDKKDFLPLVKRATPPSSEAPPNL